VHLVGFCYKNKGTGRVLLHLKTMVFYDDVSCSCVGRYKHVRVKCYLHVQGKDNR